MPLNESEILRILELFDQSDWSEIVLESGDIRCAVSKTGTAPAFADAPARTPAAALAPVPSTAPATTTPVAPARNAPSGPAIDPSWVAITAPLLGTFYAAPKPGAPAFVKVGQAVGPDDTVCILEVMKLMNHVKAGVAGTVAHIAVANGELAEFEQVLMYIDPA